MNKKGEGNYFFIVAMVAIVAVVGIVVLTMGVRTPVAGTTANTNLALEEESQQELSGNARAIYGTPIVHPCTDSDGGVNIYEKGRTLDSTATLPFTDGCISDKIVKEHWCKNDRVYGDDFVCEYGCSDGACLR